MAFEKALRLAAVGHCDQTRKGSDTPYIEHPMAVALILDRSGFEEDVVIAGLLHDLVEDTGIPLDMLRDAFGEDVANIVAFCSEEKLDVEGRKRPWIDRKRDHLEAMSRANDAVRAVVLADKLHNLLSIKLDIQLDGGAVWDSFNAGRDQVLWYYGAMIDACHSEDPRLIRLLGECRGLLSEVAAIGR